MLFHATTFFHASSAITSIPTYSANSVSTFFRASISRVAEIPAFSASYLNQLGPKVDTFFPPAIGSSRIPTFSAKFRGVEHVTPPPEADKLDLSLDELLTQVTQQQLLAQDDDANLPIPDMKIVNKCGAPLSAFDVGTGVTQIIPAGASSFVGFESLDDSMQLSWALDPASQLYGYAEVTLAEGVHSPYFSLNFLEGNPFQLWGQTLDVENCDTVACSPGEGQCPRTLHHLDHTSGADARIACSALREAPELTFTACSGLGQEGVLPEGMPSHPNFS